MVGPTIGITAKVDRYLYRRDPATGVCNIVYWSYDGSKAPQTSMETHYIFDDGSDTIEKFRKQGSLSAESGRPTIKEFNVVAGPTCLLNLEHRCLEAYWQGFKAELDARAKVEAEKRQMLYNSGFFPERPEPEECEECGHEYPYYADSLTGPWHWSSCSLYAPGAE